MFILHRLLVHTPTQPDLHQTQNVPLTHQHACFFSVSVFILLLPLFFRFTQPLRDFVLSGKPFFGICIGMQCLFEGSEEAPGVPGLGLVPGRVRRFQVDQVSTSTVRWAGCRQGRVRHSAGCWSTCVCHLVIAQRSKKTGLGQHTRSSSHSHLIAHTCFPCRAHSLTRSQTPPGHPHARRLQLGLAVPEMGWNGVNVRKHSVVLEPGTKQRYYFVHSFIAVSVVCCLLSPGLLFYTHTF